ncbi:MAG: DUF4402 domain-containing protein [Flavobacterium sp.]|nr:DUF4402 domain-containing protein [Flavobacterium sp.]
MIKIKSNQYRLLHLLVLAMFFLFINNLNAQPGLPQREITVVPTQPIDFGTFYVTGAGSIKVDFQGNVFTTGGVISVNTSSVTPAIFEIKLCQGRTVTLSNVYSVYINGSNGGQLELVIGEAKRDGLGDILTNGSSFAVDTNCTFTTILRAGGTLIVPANAVPGIYVGSFPMTFTQQ